jgi:UDPglucose 6-dehydrogenase
LKEAHKIINMNKVAVIGIGRLGLCFALNLEKVGYTVWGIDTNLDYLAALQSKSFQSNEPELESYLKAATAFYPVSDSSVIFDQNIDYIFILVPTPSKQDGSFSHDYIDELVSQLLRKTPLDGKQRHIIIGSTVMPGYCDSLFERVHSFGYTINYNPEFIAQGSIIRDQQFPDQILIGEGHEDVTLKLKEIYGKMCQSNPTFHAMSLKSAEICKLATNCFLTMKISFANAIGDLANKTGANPNEILAAIGSDSRIGTKYLNYGFGYGGPCFPRDNQALSKFATQNEFPLYLSQATINVNKQHLEYQLEDYINANREEYIFDYVTYKKDTDILEESQQFQLALELVKSGKKVKIKNSALIQDKIEKEYPNHFEFI